MLMERKRWSGSFIPGVRKEKNEDKRQPDNCEAADSLIFNILRVQPLSHFAADGKLLILSRSLSPSVFSIVVRGRRMQTTQCVIKNETSAGRWLKNCAHWRWISVLSVAQQHGATGEICRAPIVPLNAHSTSCCRSFYCLKSA